MPMQISKGIRNEAREASDNKVNSVSSDSVVPQVGGRSPLRVCLSSWLGYPINLATLRRWISAFTSPPINNERAVRYIHIIKTRKTPSVPYVVL
jgi:hypothetical protein